MNAKLALFLIALTVGDVLAEPAMKGRPHFGSGRRVQFRAAPKGAATGNDKDLDCEKTENDTPQKIADCYEKECGKKDNEQHSQCLAVDCTVDAAGIADPVEKLLCDKFKKCDGGKKDHPFCNSAGGNNGNNGNNGKQCGKPCAKDPATNQDKSSCTCKNLAAQYGNGQVNICGIAGYIPFLGAPLAVAGFYIFASVDNCGNGDNKGDNNGKARRLQPFAHKRKMQLFNQLRSHPKMLRRFLAKKRADDPAGFGTIFYCAWRCNIVNTLIGLLLGWKDDDMTTTQKSDAGKNNGNTAAAIECADPADAATKGTCVTTGSCDPAKTLIAAAAAVALCTDPAMKDCCPV